MGVLAAGVLSAAAALAPPAVVAAAAAPVTGSAPPAFAPAETPSTRTFQPISDIIGNPDRGLYHYTETHARADGSGANPLKAATAALWRTREGVTLVYRIFYLERYVDTDRLDPAYLQAVRADLAAARSAGVKLVVRFAYSADTSVDAPVDRVVAHVRQLVPVLNEFAPVVAVLQAGFVGRWGEWYYSDSFTTDRSRPWALTQADWQARGRVLTALLESTDPTVFVQVRYPGIKQRLLADAPAAIAARVGIHNDCFLASADDYGTIPTTGDVTWLRDQTRTVPMGGETCAVNAPRSEWASASADLATYHWSYLNADFQSEVLRSWGGAALDEVRRRLGYRLRLTTAAVPTVAAPGAGVQVQVTLANDGYAAPFRVRPARLIFRDSRGLAPDVAVDVPIDLRNVAPGAQTSFTVTATAPDRPGSYELYLALPDPSPALAADPAYSVRLSNVGTWDARTGWNNLGSRVTVTG